MMRIGDVRTEVAGDIVLADLIAPSLEVFDQRERGVPIDDQAFDKSGL
jgi:hypothetical protein